MTQRNMDPNTDPNERQDDDFDRDLHPNQDAGINHGQVGASPEADARNAAEITDLRAMLPDFTNDELERIIVLSAGDRLEQGATYIDLATPTRNEFTAESGGMVVGDTNIIVPKRSVDYQIWNRLRGVDAPERTGQADE